MKRLFALLCIILASMPIVFCASQITTGETSNFNIKGYLDPSDETEFTFMVWTGDSEDNRIYHSGSVVIDNPESLSNVAAFKWRLGWSGEISMTLSFTFTAMQASFDGMYYIPKHSFTMTTSSGKTDTTTYGQKASGNYPYPKPYSDANTRNRTMSYTVNESSAGTLEGACTFTILDYESEISGDFTYTGYIKVEFTVQ